MYSVIDKETLRKWRDPTCTTKKVQDLRDRMFCQQRRPFFACGLLHFHQMFFSLSIARSIHISDQPRVEDGDARKRHAITVKIGRFTIGITRKERLTRGRSARVLEL